jgi:GNAT superfamily N-acetyltransferase
MGRVPHLSRLVGRATETDVTPDRAGPALTLAVRRPRVDELEAMRRIGELAGQRFAEVGMDDIANDPPFTLDELEQWRAAGRAWVRTVDGEPVGFAVVDVLDGAAHIEEVDVLPDAQGAGHGVALLDHIAAWARANGLSAVTLTTFRDVPWNRPFYERHGFEVIALDRLPPELAQRRDDEAAHGLDPAQRVCMRRAV